ncbi:hypothetical protein GGF37_004994, partial [Kickxella alabastrina]
MSGGIGRPSMAHKNSRPFLDTGLKIRKRLRDLKRRLPMASKGVYGSKGITNNSVGSFLSDSSDVFVDAKGDPDYRLPRNLRPSSLFHLRVRYDTIRVGTGDGPAGQDPGSLGCSGSGTDLGRSSGVGGRLDDGSGEDTKFAFSPSITSVINKRIAPTAPHNLPPMPATAHPTGHFPSGIRCPEPVSAPKQALLLSYDMGRQEGGLRSIQTAVDSLPYCCCCSHRHFNSYGVVSNSSWNSSRGHLSPLHSLMPSFTGNAQFVHTQAGPALDISEPMGMPRMCPCHGQTEMGGEVCEPPLPAMRIRLQPRAATSPSVVAVYGDSSVTDGGSQDGVSLLCERKSYSAINCHRTPLANTVKVRKSQPNFVQPEYLRISETSSAIPSPSPSHSASQVSSNHLLLSGIDSGFVSQRVFVVHPGSVPPTRSEFQQIMGTAEFLEKENEEASRSLLAASIRSVRVVEGEITTALGANLTQLAEDLANFRLSAVGRPESQSDSCSFCTAMSNLTAEDSSGEDLMHSSDDEHKHEHEREHEHKHGQNDGEIKIEIKTERFEHELDEEAMSQDLHTDSPAKGYGDTPWETSMMPDEYKACWDQPKRQDSPTSPDDFSPEWTEPASPDPETAESDRITHADTNIDGHS